MAPRVDPVELAKILDDAGTSSRSRKKILKHNEAGDPPATRGHGAASEVRTDFGSF
ncbi:hypothetical protein KC949_00940 [Candidatus Saccharibacteria bacterium]|jgi:hypothetical protein|nr:hypothetical protein [Candidatus Saccharibacteria bacterium]